MLAAWLAYCGSSQPLVHAMQVNPRPVRLPDHGLTAVQLNAKRFGLQAIAPAQCRLLASEMKSLKEFITDDIRLDRPLGLEQSGNKKWVY